MANKTTARVKLPLISVVILNWNGLDDTLQCLDSVEELSYQNIEVVIVDNGSKGSLKPLEKRTSNKIKLIKNPVNLGFAGGEVSALAHCKGEFILLLNNDATIDKNAIEQCLKTFALDEKIAVVGSKSYTIDADGNHAHSFYSFQRVDPITADVMTYNRDLGTILDVPTVSGSGVMIRREAINKYGYFDERFFAYYEETDLFARYIRAGLRVVYDPSFVIWHKDGASTKNHRFMYYYLMLKNQFLFAYKNFEKSYLKDFRKSYFRNFRRSLWVYLKDGSKTEAIHKARVRSTVWNLVYLPGTILSRHKAQSINPNFNYNDLLLTEQRIPVSLIIDATSSEESSIQDALKNVLLSHAVPSEIIVVSSSALESIPQSGLSIIRNIVDKKIFSLTAYDFGFMSSNTDIIKFSSVNELASIKPEVFGDNIASLYRSMVASESSVAIDKKELSSFKSNLQLITSTCIEMVGLRKSELVTFLDITPNTSTINSSTLSMFLAWCVSECKTISRLPSQPSELVQNIPTPKQHSYPILNNPIKWHVKNTLRKLHLSRIVGKLRKHILPSSSDETVVEAINEASLSKSHENAIVKNFPVFINTRDRFDPLVKLVDWLEQSNQKRIAFIDNESTNPELVEFFKTTPYQVIPLGRNGMHKAPWESFAVRFLAKDSPYLLSDPDIIPTRDTPKSTIKHLYSVLCDFPNYDKVGVALKIDDLPDHYQMKQSVLDWESRFWDGSLLLRKDVYAADIDTTLALYKGGTGWFLSPSIRVAGKYAMQHEPWYQDLDKPTGDMLYYKIRASNEVSTWTKGKLPKHHIRALKKEGLI